MLPYVLTFWASSVTVGHDTSHKDVVAAVHMSIHSGVLPWAQCAFTSAVLTQYANLLIAHVTVTQSL